MMELARRDLIDFSITVDEYYDPNWHHEVIAEKLMAVERGEIKRLMIFMPPRHGKSRLASIDFPAWYLGRHPDGQIITSSYSSDLAKDFGENTRDLVSSFEYGQIFPDTLLKQDSKSKDKWKVEERAEKGKKARQGYYISVGVGGPITGRGAKIALIDDPFKNREEAESQTIRDKVHNWYTSTMYTRLEKGGAIILIMTRWHNDDLAGRLIEEMENGGEQWEIVEFPAVAEKNEEYRKEGEALWPDKYPLEDLQRIKGAVGVRDWASLYQQKPIITENQEFKEETFRYFEESDIVEKNFSYTIAVDPAISKADTADRTGITVVGKEVGKPEWYVLEAMGHRLDPLELIDTVFSLYNEYRKRGPVKVGIETVAYQKSLIYYMKEEMKQREDYIHIQELKNSNKKEERIRGLIPLFNTGVIFLRRNYALLHEELLTFPSGRHDDVLDSLASHLEMQKPTSTRARRRSGRQRVVRNRNPITGY